MQVLQKCLTLRANADNAIKAERQRPNGYIYFLYANGLCKIGKTTRTIGERVSSLKVGNARAILLGYIETENCHVLEKQLHAEYGRLRKKGEWFKLSMGEVREIIDCFRGTVVS